MDISSPLSIDMNNSEEYEKNDLFLKKIEYE